VRLAVVMLRKQLQRKLVNAFFKSRFTVHSQYVSCTTCSAGEIIRNMISNQNQVRLSEMILKIEIKISQFDLIWKSFFFQDFKSQNQNHASCM